MAVTRRLIGCLLMVAMMMMMMFASSVTGRTVIVSSVKVYPYLGEVLGSEPDNIQYEGFMKDLMDKVGELISVNFTFRTTEQFGARLENGTWTGMMGDVISKEADLAAGPLTITAERSRKVRFSTPFQHFAPVMLMKKPDMRRPSFFERSTFFLFPFSNEIWMMILVSYLVTSVVLYVICYANPYEWRHLLADHQATRREAESFTCLNTFWFVLSALMWQGYVRAPRSLGGRVTVSAWWMFVVVVLLTYTASLTNLMRAGPMYSTPLTPITSLKALASQSQLRYGFVKGGATERFLKNSKDADHVRLWNTVHKQKTYVKDVEEGVKQARVNRLVFLTESSMADYHVRRKPCDVMMVGKQESTGSYALAYLPGWDLADEVDRALLGLKENGNLGALMNKWLAGESCDRYLLDPHDLDKNSNEPPFIQITLGSFSGILVLLAAGLVLGAIVTVFEVVIFRLAEKTPDHQETSATAVDTKTKAGDKAAASDATAV